MSEKLQHTAARTQEQMSNRYGDGLHHKHDKCHIAYRLHHPSHPSQITSRVDGKENINGSTEHFPLGKLRKFRQRMANSRYH